jgi:hypothetical protein
MKNNRNQKAIKSLKKRVRTLPPYSDIITLLALSIQAAKLEKKNKVK